jgi:hypothetical protein
MQKVKKKLIRVTNFQFFSQNTFYVNRHCLFDRVRLKLFVQQPSNAIVLLPSYCPYVLQCLKCNLRFKVYCVVRKIFAFQSLNLSCITEKKFL